MTFPPNHETTLSLRINPHKIAIILTLIAVTLCVLSVILKAVEWELSTNSTYWYYQLVLLFNVNEDGNIPTFYSALLLIICVLLLALMAYHKYQTRAHHRHYWFLLMLVFFYLAVDEAAEIHEIFTIPMREAFNLTGHFYFGWVVLGAIFVLLVASVFVRFWWNLPAPTRRLFFVAALFYVGGALGIESISANQWYLNDGTSLLFSTIGAIEEFCEMFGAVILIYALLINFKNENCAVRFII